MKKVTDFITGCMVSFDGAAPKQAFKVVGENGGLDIRLCMEGQK
jgi:hypothetical protein